MCLHNLCLASEVHPKSLYWQEESWDWAVNAFCDFDDQNPKALKLSYVYEIESTRHYNL